MLVQVRGLQVRAQFKISIHRANISETNMRHMGITISDMIKSTLFIQGDVKIVVCLEFIVSCNQMNQNEESYFIV